MFSSSKFIFTNKKTGAFYCLGGPECQSCQYIVDIENYVGQCVPTGPFATEQACLDSCSRYSSSSSSVENCVTAPMSTINRDLRFHDTLPATSSPLVVAMGKISRREDRVRVNIDSVVPLGISAGQIFYAPLPYSWPYGDQDSWADAIYPYTLKVESVALSEKMSGGQIVEYNYIVTADCAIVPNSNSITTPEISLTNFRLDGNYKIDFSVSSTIFDSKYEANPTMKFFIEYQVPGCEGQIYNGWRTVFNSLPPNASPSNGKPKTFTQSYTMTFSNSENCRVAVLDGLLSIPYGGKIRVKATHGPLLLFSSEIQLPEQIP